MTVLVHVTAGQHRVNVTLQDGSEKTLTAGDSMDVETTNEGHPIVIRELIETTHTTKKTENKPTPATPATPVLTDEEVERKTDAARDENTEKDGKK